MPGVGLNIEKDAIYSRLYDQWLSDVDVILWTVKADDRALAIDEEFHRIKIAPRLKKDVPVIFIVNQCDKIDPIDNWNSRTNSPGAKQKKNLDSKRLQIARLFKLSDRESIKNVVFLAASKHYGIQDLLFAIVDSVPRFKRPSIVRQASREAISQQVVASIESAVEEELNEALIIGGIPVAVVFAAKGAAIGSVLGPVGALVGAAVGAIGGASVGATVYTAAMSAWAWLKKKLS